MVQQYNRRLKEARLELVETARKNLSQLVADRYTGGIAGGRGIIYIMPGNGDIVEMTSDIIPIPSSIPELIEGYERVPKTRRVTPNDIPLESYPIPDLLRMANAIEEAQRHGTRIV